MTLTQPVLDAPSASVTRRFWPVSWMRAVDPLQLTAAMQLLARSLADLMPSVAVTTAIQVGGGQPAEAWIGAHTCGPGEDGFRLAETLTASLLPVVGVAVDQAVEALPAIDPAAGMCFRLSHEGSTPWPCPTGSRLLEVLGHSPALWQFTAGSGLVIRDFPADDGEAERDRFDVALSVLGSGPEVAVVPALLSMDISLPADLVTVTPCLITTDEDLEQLAAMGRAGIAPPAGLLRPSAVGRLLTVPLRVEGNWPMLRAAPSDPQAATRAIKATTPPHALVTGGSGQGKTTLLHRWAVETAAEGQATLVTVDPHGDLAVRIASSLDARRIPFGVLDFGAGDPLAWNILGTDENCGMLAAQAAATIRNLWSDMPEEYFGPVWFRSARILIEILVRDPAGPHPITRLPEFFAKRSPARDEALERIADPNLSRSVEEEILPAITGRDAGHMALWVTSKMERLIGNPWIARIIGTTCSEISLSPILEGRHTVVSAPMGRLGGDGARLLCSLLIDRLWQEAQKARPARPIELFIDEWHRIPSPAITALLAEGRKFGFRLRLANQNAAQIPQQLWETALANTGALVTFRTGPKDAVLLDPLFPSVPLLTLTQLPKHWAAVAIDGEDQVIRTLPPLDSDVDEGAIERGHQLAKSEARRAGREQLAIALTAYRDRRKGERRPA